MCSLSLVIFSRTEYTNLALKYYSMYFDAFQPTARVGHAAVLSRQTPVHYLSGFRMIFFSSGYQDLENFICFQFFDSADLFFIQFM